MAIISVCRDVIMALTAAYITAVYQAVLAALSLLADTTSLLIHEFISSLAEKLEADAPVLTH